MQKQTKLNVSHSGMIPFVSHIINVIFGKSSSIENQKKEILSKVTLKSQNDYSIGSGKKIMKKKSSKSLRITNNLTQKISTVEVKRNGIHIRLVPLSNNDFQKKRVKAYKYLEV